MGSSTASYIIVKGSADGDKAKAQGIKAFYGPHDKGSAKPSFCYPQQKDTLREEIKGMEKALADGFVSESRVLKMKQDLKVKKARLDGINSQEADAMKLFKENKDSIVKRREELAEIIAQGMPSVNDVEKRRTNPHMVLAAEKKGLKGGIPLGKAKQEYQILSHLVEEESNTRFLQRD
jgi:hypothetical protein